ncbi:hypothetical protein ACJZ2D_001118 [Fusarium nematophilum]
MPELKIAKIGVFQVDLPYSGGVYHLSGGRTYETFDGTVVRITTENGIEGWGESTPFCSTYIASHGLGVRAGIAGIAPRLVWHSYLMHYIAELLESESVQHAESEKLTRYPSR